MDVVFKRVLADTVLCLRPKVRIDTAYRVPDSRSDGIAMSDMNAVGIRPNSSGHSRFAFSVVN